MYRINFRRSRERELYNQLAGYLDRLDVRRKELIRMMAVKIERGRFNKCYKARVPSPWAVVLLGQLHSRQ